MLTQPTLEKLKTLHLYAMANAWLAQQSDPAIHELDFDARLALVVDAEGHSVNEMGSYETGFWENDGNRAFWDLPNIVAFQAR